MACWDEQLAYVLAFAGVATAGRPRAAGRAAGRLGGLDALPGRASTAPALLGRPASLTLEPFGVRVFGLAEIDAKLARDATRPRAARGDLPRGDPHGRGERETWRTLISGELTIAMFRAALARFVDLDHPELIEPYLYGYFAVVGDVWRDWSSAMAQDFVKRGQPGARDLRGDGRGHRRHRPG